MKKALYILFVFLLLTNCKKDNDNIINCPSEVNLNLSVKLHSGSKAMFPYNGQPEYFSDSLGNTIIFSVKDYMGFHDWTMNYYGYCSKDSSSGTIYYYNGEGAYTAIANDSLKIGFEIFIVQTAICTQPILKFLDIIAIHEEIYVYDSIMGMGGVTGNYYPSIYLNGDLSKDSIMELNSKSFILYDSITLLNKTFYNRHYID